MIYNLPTKINIDGQDYKIRNNGDYRVILDIINVLNDDELNEQEKAYIAISIFYDGEIDENLNFMGELPQDTEKAYYEILKFINCGDDLTEEHDPKVMDWEQDFWCIAPEINKIIGYEVREENKYTHWFSFIGAYMGITGEGTFNTFVSIRKKIISGKKLDNWELELYRKNKKKIDLESCQKDDWLNGDD